MRVGLDIDGVCADCLLVTRPHNIKFDVGDKRVKSILEFQNKYLLCTQ